MKFRSTYYLLLFCLPVVLHAQQDSVEKVKYSKDFVFTDGIYLTFQEFRDNNPSIKRFYVKKNSSISDPNYVKLEYTCPDSANRQTNCEIKDCWGYCYKGDVYIAHVYLAYYYRLMVIGSLCHYAGLSSSSGEFNPGTNLVGVNTDRDFQQFFLDIETGKTYFFNYKTFSAFLKVKDSELYSELMKQKRKRKLIFQYLLKYNEKHPLWVAAGD